MGDYSVNFEEIPVKGDEGTAENDKTNEDVLQNSFLGTLCLFYSSSSFSDFAPFPFIIDGKLFQSVEHYIQLQMFQSFGLFSLANKLNSITDAFEFRRAVRQSIKSVSKSDIFSEKMFQDWRDKNLEKQLRRANYAKYQQNLLVREQLMQTGDRILIFTAKNDAVFGVGMSEMSFFNWISSEKITFEDLLNYFCNEKLRPKELGKNLLGLILMEIRADINGRQSVIAEWKQKLKSSDKISTFASLPTSILSQTSDNQCGDDSTTIEQSSSDSSLFAQSSPLSKTNVIQKAFDKSPAETNLNMVDNGILFFADLEDCSVDNQNKTFQKVSDRTVVFLRDERRILYHKIGAEPKIIGEIREKQHIFDEPPSCSAVKTCSKINSSVSIEEKQTALERLKALRFEKPIINPFTVATSSELSVTKLTNDGASTSSASILSTEKDTKQQNYEIVEEISVFKRPRLQPPLIGTGDVYDLEPGEVPHPNYKSPPLFFKRLKHQSDYPEIPSLIDLAFQRGFNEPDPNVSLQVDQSKKSWKPSDNPLKDLLYKAQETLKKLEESGEKQNLAVPAEPVFPSFPVTTKVPEQRNLKRKKKIGKQYKVQFTNDTAMLRHHSNRWIRGGKLSTTGKFEEGDEIDDEQTFEEQTKVIQMLEEAEENMNKKHYETHVAFEDTHQYEEYLKWHAETHNQPQPGTFDDARQTEQRRWYQFYRNAVKFIDVPDDSDDQRASTDQSEEMNSHVNDFAGISNCETYDIMLQQWRWKQIHQWKPNLSNDNVSVTSTACSDGVSYGGQPVVYQKPFAKSTFDTVPEGNMISSTSVSI